MNIEQKIDNCIKAFTELKESLYKDEYSYIEPMADELVKLIESPNIPNSDLRDIISDNIIRINLGRGKGNTTLMCMLLNRFKYNDDWKVVPVVRNRHSVSYVFDRYHHRVNTSEQNIVDMKGYRHKGNVLVLVDSIPEEELQRLIRSVGMHLSPDANLKIVVLGDCL